MYPILRKFSVLMWLILVMWNFLIPFPWTFFFCGSPAVTSVVTSYLSLYAAISTAPHVLAHFYSYQCWYCWFLTHWSILRSLVLLCLLTEILHDISGLYDRICYIFHMFWLSAWPWRKVKMRAEKKRTMRINFSSVLDERNEEDSRAKQTRCQIRNNSDH